MPNITEGRLQLTFPEDCVAIKYDDTPWYRTHFTQHKALDVLAVLAGQRHYWIEIKDCRGFEAENQPRVSSADPIELEASRMWIKEKGWEKLVKAQRAKPFIIDEIVGKIHDTITGLSIARHTKIAELVPYADWQAANEAPVFVLLLGWEGQDFKRLARLLTTKLEHALLPYGISGLIIHPNMPSKHLDFSITHTGSDKEAPDQR